MSLSEAFDVAHLVEVILAGKQQLAPILADAKAALASALKVIEGLEALNAEVQATRTPPSPTQPRRPP